MTHNDTSKRSCLPMMLPSCDSRKGRTITRAPTLTPKQKTNKPLATHHIPIKQANISSTTPEATMAEAPNWSDINEAAAAEPSSLADLLQIPERILRAFQLDPSQLAEDLPAEAVEHIQSTIVAGIDRLFPEDQEAVRDTQWGREGGVSSAVEEDADEETLPATEGATSDRLANTSIADTGIVQAQFDELSYPIVNAEGSTAVFNPPLENPDTLPPPGWRRMSEVADRSMVSPSASSEEPETGVGINEEGVRALEEEIERLAERE